MERPGRYLAPNSVLAGKYLILKPCDEDGVSVTYLAHNRQLDIEVNIREYFPEDLAARDPADALHVTVSAEKEALFSEGLRRFLEEAQSLARRGASSSTATVLDFFRENGTAYAVMSGARSAVARGAEPVPPAAPQPAEQPAAQSTEQTTTQTQNAKPAAQKPPLWTFLAGGAVFLAVLLVLFLPRGEKMPAAAGVEPPSPSSKAAFVPRTSEPAPEATVAPTTPEPASEPTPEATERMITRAELAETNRFTVACGNRHVAYIRPDGSLGGVGSDLYGQLSFEGSAGVVRDLAAGYAHTVLLLQDGSVRATKILSPSGAEPYDYGQSDVGNWKNVIAIEAGWVHTVALLSDGTVLAAGDNAHGQCDVSAWRDVVEVAAGGWNTAALITDGRVLVAGDNEYGQCDLDWSGETIVHIAVGRQFVAGLRADGTVIAAGRNLQHQLEVSGWSNIAMIAVGDHHTIGLTVDGRVKTTSFTGTNACGQDLTGDWRDVIAVYGGARSTLGLCVDGTLLVAGLVDADTYANVGALPEKAAIFLPWWVHTK
ncbi:MAG: hypothetical protein ABFC62_12320 [Clostridiaceae bacterium]